MMIPEVAKAIYQFMHRVPPANGATMVQVLTGPEGQAFARCMQALEAEMTAPPKATSDDIVNSGSVE